MALDGIPMRKVGAELGVESLFRRTFAPPKTGSGEPSKALVAEVRSMIHGLPLPESVKAPLLRALDGDPVAQAALDDLGPWRMFRLGMTSELNSWFRVVVEHGVEIEITGKEVDNIVRAREFDRLPDLLRSSPALSP